MVISDNCLIYSSLHSVTAYSVQRVGHSVSRISHIVIEHEVSDISAAAVADDDDDDDDDDDESSDESQ